MPGVSEIKYLSLCINEATGAQKFGFLYTFVLVYYMRRNFVNIIIESK